MTFDTFSRMNFVLNGDGTGIDTEADLQSAADNSLTEVSGGTQANTLEENELFSDPILANDYEYVGFIDHGGIVGRLFVFRNADDAGRFIVSSFADLPLAFDTGNNWPDTILFADLNTSNVVFCFFPGTLIDTPSGRQPVESLQIGDMVKTHDGREEPVKWVGRQYVPTVFDLADQLRPVRVKRGSLGNGLPERDLTVTADHALYLDGSLITAGALVNGTSIVEVPLAELGSGYTIYHIETETHDMVLAEGAIAETFVDCQSRKSFENYQEYVDLYGEEGTTSELSLPRIASRRLVPQSIKDRVQRHVTEFLAA